MQFITHYTERYSYLDAARMALEGGCRWVQLRMKDTPVETMEPVALEVQALCRQYGATFIIDDHVELAKKLHADGVHLGKKDMPIADARRILGAEYIIGGTANTFEDVSCNTATPVPTTGLRPFPLHHHQEESESDTGTRRIHRYHAPDEGEGIRIPIVAIGGITIADIPAVMQTGVSGIALSGTVLHADSPADEMKRIISLMENEK